MAFDPVSAGIEAGTSLADTALQQYFTRENMKLQQDYNRENMQKSFEYQQQAERNTALNRLVGLKQSGFSTALANGGNFTTAASPASVPSSAALNPRSNLKMSSVELASAANQAAQADVAKEQARALRISNENQESANATSDLNARYVLNLWKQEADAKGDNGYSCFLQGLIDESHSYDVGSVKALMEFSPEQIQARVSEANKRISEAQRDDFIAQFQTSSPLVFNALSKMPLEQYRQLQSLSSKLVAEKQLLNSEKDLTDEKKNEVSANILKIYQETKKLFHSDDLALLEEEGLGTVIAKLGMESVSSLSQGFGQGLGYGTAGLVTRGGSMKNAPSFKGDSQSMRSMPRPSKGMVNRQVERLHKNYPGSKVRVLEEGRKIEVTTRNGDTFYQNYKHKWK